MATGDDQRFAAGNAFARALKGEDADRPLHPVPRVLATVLIAPLLVLAVLLPPLFTYGLLREGLRAGRPGMIAGGLLFAAIYLALVVGVIRKRAR